MGGEFSLQQVLCTALPEVQRARGANESAAAITAVCVQLRNHGVNDTVTVIPSKRPNELWVRYTDTQNPGVAGVLRFGVDGSVYDGALSPRPFAGINYKPVAPDDTPTPPISGGSATVEGKAGVILLGGLGGLPEVQLSRLAGAGSSVRGAIEYVRCRTTGSAASCAPQLVTVASAAQTERTQALAKARLEQEQRAAQEIDTIYRGAQAQWQRYDAFIAEAKRRDDNDSDLDKLMAILQKYNYARIHPASLEGARELRETIARLYGEFTNSPALDGLLVDEGDCTDHIVLDNVSRCSLGERGQSGTKIYDRTCSILDFSTTSRHKDKYYCEMKDK